MTKEQTVRAELCYFGAGCASPSRRCSYCVAFDAGHLAGRRQGLNDAQSQVREGYDNGYRAGVASESGRVAGLEAEIVAALEDAEGLISGRWTPTKDLEDGILSSIRAVLAKVRP